MTEHSVSIALSGSSDLESPSGVAAALAGQSTMVVAGLSIARLPSSELNYVQKYVGERTVPGDIKRLRRSSLEMMRRLGTPVIVKHMYNDEDRRQGVADESPVYRNVLGSTRQGDMISHGVGFVSREKSTNEWIAPSALVVDEDPGGDAPLAPKFRGYGPGFLTWIVEPDAALDFYKHSEEGVFIRVQTAQATAPWWPEINDNDLIIHVVLDRQGKVLETTERYEAKMTDPVSIRGLDRRGRQEYGGDLGNRHVINQTFEMALLPEEHPSYGVEIDR